MKFDQYSQFICLIFYFYLIQGLPYGLQAKFLPIFMRSKGFSLSSLSMMKLLYLPLIIKTFYAPLIHIYLSKKIWLQISIILLFLNCLTFSFVEKLNIAYLIVMILIMNLFCTMQDIALDALTISIMTGNRVHQANAIQVVGYKVGSLFGGGIMILISQFVKWSGIFMILSLFYAVGLILTFLLDDLSETINSENLDNEVEARTDLWLSTYFQILKKSIKDSNTYFTIIYLLIYKLGEQGATNMLPLFLIDRKVKIGPIGLWIGIIGQLVSLCGSAFAAVFVSSYKSTFDAIKSLSLLIAPLITCLVIVVSPNFYHRFPNYIFIISVIIINTIFLISGILTTATFTLMMQCSQTRPVHIQATHYTIIATVEVLGKLLFTSGLGVFTDRYGYRSSYMLFTILSWSTCLFLRLFSNSFQFSTYNGLFNG